MRVDRTDPPRSFTVGHGIEIKDCGRIALAPDEQVTFLTEAGAEYDVVRKDWGFYATPSLNERLPRFGLRTAFIQNRQSKRYYVVLVEKDREAAFQSYLAAEDLRIVRWLDSDEACRSLDREVGRGA